jgi:hypothetical protein
MYIIQLEMCIPVDILLVISIVIINVDYSPNLFNLLFKCSFSHFNTLGHNKCCTGREHEYDEEDETKEHHEGAQVLVVATNRFSCDTSEDYEEG